MSTYTKFEDYKEAVKSAYANCWDEVFNVIGSSPTKVTKGSYTYYDATDLCHAEKTPSVQEFPTALHCYGCKESMDIFNVTMKLTTLGFRESVMRLGEAKGLILEEDKTNNNNNNNKKENSLYSTELQMVFALFAHVTHQLLFNDMGKDAQKYLVGRGLNLEYLSNLKFTLANKKQVFGCGYLPFTKTITKDIKEHMLNILVSTNQSINTMQKLEQLLVDAKLVNNNGNFKLMGRVIFPIVINGYIVNVYGRKISDDNDYPPHMYLELQNHGFYNFDTIKKNETGILCECIIDSVSLMQHGLPAFSTFGVGGWKTHECTKMLRSSKIKNLMFLYDKDNIKKIEEFSQYAHHSSILQKIGPAGLKSAIRTAREVENILGLKPRIMDLPYHNGNESNDVNKFIKHNVNKSTEEIQEFFLDLYKSALDADTAELLIKLEIMNVNSKFYGDKDKAEVILEALNNTNPVNAVFLIDEVSKHINIPYEILFKWQMFNMK